MSYDKTLEEYKIFLATAKNVSDRRMKSNRFFITIMTVIFSFISVVLSTNYIARNRGYVIIAIWIFCLGLCKTWSKTLESFAKLNSAKFDVILEMEKELKYNAFAQEWKKLTTDKTYKILSWNEKQIPRYFAWFISIVFVGYFFLGYAGS